MTTVCARTNVPLTLRQAHVARRKNSPDRLEHTVAKRKDHRAAFRASSVSSHICAAASNPVRLELPAISPYTKAVPGLLPLFSAGSCT